MQPFVLILSKIVYIGQKMKPLRLLVLIPLIGCGTPQERCIGAASRDMRVVDRLITEGEGNLARGYAYENVTVFMPEWQDCTPRATTANPDPKQRLCFEDVPQTIRKAVAIDLRAEADKLVGLRQKRASQARSIAGPIADCKAKFPE